jgi:hypothetical protein
MLSMLVPFSPLLTIILVLLSRWMQDAGCLNTKLKNQETKTKSGTEKSGMLNAEHKDAGRGTLHSRCKWRNASKILRYTQDENSKLEWSFRFQVTSLGKRRRLTRNARRVQVKLQFSLLPYLQTFLAQAMTIHILGIKYNRTM